MKELTLFENEHCSGVLAAVRDYYKDRSKGCKVKRKTRQAAMARKSSLFGPETRKAGASQSDY
jgi:hypothetical protein